MIKRQFILRYIVLSRVIGNILKNKQKYQDATEHRRPSQHTQCIPEILKANISAKFNGDRKNGVDIIAVSLSHTNCFIYKIIIFI